MVEDLIRKSAATLLTDSDFSDGQLNRVTSQTRAE